MVVTAMVSLESGTETSSIAPGDISLDQSVFEGNGFAVKETVQRRGPLWTRIDYTGTR